MPAAQVALPSQCLDVFQLHLQLLVFMATWGLCWVQQGPVNQTGKGSWFVWRLPRRSQAGAGKAQGKTTSESE